MKPSVLLSSILCLTVCSCSSVSWKKGTWTVTELVPQDHSDECELLSVFESISPLSYEFGPSGESYGSTTMYLKDSGDGEGAEEGQLLTEQQTAAGLDNLWTLCGEPYGSPTFWCDYAVEGLHADKWLPQAQEILSERNCSVEGYEAKVSRSYSEGGFLSREEALINSDVRFECYSPSTGRYQGRGDCTIRMTSRLRPAD